MEDQLSIFDLDSQLGKMFREPSPAASRKARTFGSSSKNSSELSSIPFMSLDLTPGAGNLLDEYFWEILSPWRGGCWILNTGPAPRSGAAGSTLWSIMEERPHPRYFLTRKACAGIIRRASGRGKPLPPQLQQALEIQAGLRDAADNQAPVAFHINQRDEGIDLNGVSGALLATRNTQMQTFVTQPDRSDAVGIDGYNGDISGNVSATLGTTCGMSTGRNGVMHPPPVGIDSRHACTTGELANTLGTNCGSSTGRNGIMQSIAFAQNQRDEVRNLHDVAGALGSQPGMKQQTLIASGVVTKGNGDCFLTGGVHTSLTGGGGQAGQGYPCVFCLNDQGGQFMSPAENITGTLRAQMHRHQPLVLESNQKHAVVREDGKSPTLPAAMGMGGGYVPMVCFENHGVDSRYTGPHPVSPTITARAGTGGGNLPFLASEPEVYCISGNIVDREPENGGNGLGINEDVSFCLTSCDHHAIYSRQRTDVFTENNVVSTESARQHKDATDLIMQPYQETVGTLVRSDHKGISNQYVSDDKCIVDQVNLIRRLTPLECERLQGFPDGWTNIPSASDSARYKALGNSVAIPCVEYVMDGIALAYQAEISKRRRRQVYRVMMDTLAA